MKSDKSSPYDCPNCGQSNLDERSFVSKTETELVYEPSPHYIWEETHKCIKCETLYTYKNGT